VPLRRARSAAAPGAIEEDRINIFEQWESVSAVEAFRDAGPSADVQQAKRTAGTAGSTPDVPELFVAEKDHRPRRRRPTHDAAYERTASRGRARFNRADVRRLLATYDFPPDHEARTVELVLEQAEPFAGT
jgi:3-oxoacyl-(acyl-carrier-protein) synthase